MTTSELPTEGDPTDARTVNPANVPPPFSQGNTVDDDGVVIDEYFEAMGPSPIPRDYLGTDVADLPPTTRMITSSFFLNVGDQVMAFPPDPNRIRLNISSDLGSSITFAIGSEKINPLIVTSAYNTQTQTPDFSNHTGAVWIMLLSDNSDTRIYVQAITS